MRGSAVAAGRPDTRGQRSPPANRSWARAVRSPAWFSHHLPERFKEKVGKDRGGLPLTVPPPAPGPCAGCWGAVAAPGCPSPPGCWATPLPPRGPCPPRAPPPRSPAHTAGANSSHTSLEPDAVNWIKAVPGEISRAKYLKLTRIGTVFWAATGVSPPLRVCWGLPSSSSAGLKPALL